MDALGIQNVWNANVRNRKESSTAARIVMVSSVSARLHRLPRLPRGGCDSDCGSVLAGPVAAGPASAGAASAGSGMAGLSGGPLRVGPGGAGARNGLLGPGLTMRASVLLGGARARADGLG